MYNSMFFKYYQSLLIFNVRRWLGNLGHRAAITSHYREKTDSNQILHSNLGLTEYQLTDFGNNGPNLMQLILCILVKSSTADGGLVMWNLGFCFKSFQPVVYIRVLRLVKSIIHLLLVYSKIINEYKLIWWLVKVYCDWSVIIWNCILF